MRPLLLAASLSVMTLFSSNAQADDKWFYSSWPIGHFKDLDFSKRYLEEAKIPHNRQWDGELWEPAVWIEQKRGGLRLINGFYKAGILEEQTVEDNIPYLHVGPQFYNLSGYDKRRVVETVDEVYEITSADADGMFYLFDNHQSRVVGIYTRHGLQIQ